MVGVRGLEPPTPWSQTRCASQLRYTPTGDNRSELYLTIPLITRVKRLCLDDSLDRLNRPC
jgi:hypothetical protein